MKILTVILLVLFFALMISVGFYSRQKATDVNGFVLGGRSVGPWLTAFAFGTSYFSAVIFVGYAGQFGWNFGLSSTWAGLGNAFIGSLLAWNILGRRTRVMTQHYDAKTMPDFFGKRFDSKGLKIAASVIVFIFLIPYTASLYNGLSSLFGLVFDIPYWVVITVMAVLTGAYVIFGGYMATAINDFIQGIIMLFGIAAVIISVVAQNGGIVNAMKDLSVKKKSASIIVTNKNTMKNSFDQPSASPSPLNFIKPNHKSNQIKQRQNLSHISSNITNFKKINNNYNYETNNNFNSKKNIQIKNISCGDTTNYLNNKKNSLINTKINTKELLGKKIKNKVLNMKKIRRINDSFLNNYSKSYAHINNSIMSNSSNNSNSKRIRKSINSYLKKNKNELSDRIKYVQKKLSSGMNNSIFHKNDNKNIKNLIKNNSNRIIVNSILNNNNVNSMSKIHNKSFLMKTSDKKFYMIKNNNKTKTNLKQYNDKLLFERNNYSFLKCNNTFNTNDFDNSIRMKNNIIINNIIQNSPDIPPTILGSKEKNNDKVKIS